MLKKSLLTLLALLAALQMPAAPVDVSAAKSKAKQYLASQVYAGKLMAPAAIEPVLIKTEMGENATTPVYYIFNTATTFVIVAGDDRAEEILAVGDNPLDIENIPCNMRAWLNTYKEQLDWLLSNPDAQVEKPVSLKAPGAKSVTYDRLLTCNWDQGAPYWNRCKFTYNDSTYRCSTGCCATSAAMVMYYWKWPTAQVDSVPSYTGKLRLAPSTIVPYTYPSLPATTFDWANMKDNYNDNNYTSEQGDAVATLMRYVGQAEKMLYGASGSGGSWSSVVRIVDMFKRFGYTCERVSKDSYSETAWADLIKNEIAAGRPVVYSAYDTINGGGHAFNIDGYKVDNAGNAKYHVNFGWGGKCNSWCVMCSFGIYSQDEGQEAVIGIQPKMGVPVAAAATKINANGFTANWTESPGAASYTLRVKLKSLMTETFANCTFNGRQDIGSRLDKYLDNAGWTGSMVYTVVGGVRLGTSSATGNITSPALDLSADNKVSVKFKAKTLINASNCDLKISCGDASETITVPDNNEAEYTVVLDCTPTDQKVKLETAAADKCVIITEVEFYSGDVTIPALAMGSDEIIITGITDLNYKVTGLHPGTTYLYDVKAVNDDKHDLQSDWSNKIEVTTLAGVPGDVNGDYEVNIADINALIDLLLSGNTSSPNYGRADVNGDGEVNVTDLSEIINIILQS